MRRQTAPSPLSTLLVCAALAACSSGNGSGGDAGVDTPLDAGDVAEDGSGRDASEDPGEDTDDDGEPDAPPLDVAPDAELDTGFDIGDREICVPVATARAQLPPRSVDGDATIGLGGRGLSTPGVSTEVEGFPSNAVVHPSGAYAYVVTSSRNERRLLVLSTEDGALIQDQPMRDVFYGMAIAADGTRLYVSGGATRDVHGYAIDPDTGRVELTRTVGLDNFTSGLALTPDGSRLFVGSFSATRVLEVDTAAFSADPDERPEAAVVGTLTTRKPVWDVQFVPSRDEIAVSTLHGYAIELISRDGTSRGEIELGMSPMGMAVAADGSKLWVAVSGADRLFEIDLSSARATRHQVVAERDHVDDDGEPLDRSNPNDVAVSADGTRLYVTRGADNAVSVFDSATLEVLGSFPTSWYPTCVTPVPDGSTLVVCEGRGFGSDADTAAAPRDTLDGNVSFVATDLDLEASTADVLANFNRARDAFPFECDEGFFPVPTRPDMPTPIEHVILVVKENKTFDCVFGDLTDMDVDVDPSLVRWGEEITPNQHALARQFNISDNFHVEVENSDMGHLVLTTGILTDFIERMWVEVKRGSMNQGYQVAEQATPADGNFFTHLMDHGVDIRIYGQIVGMFERSASGRQPIEFSDRDYPGGIFFNMNARDSRRAEYVVERINAGELATFTFMLLPNDHTGGIAPGNPTPEAEVADNDEGVGILVEGLSRSPYWGKTVIFVVQDDPQGCSDHVDSHRSAAMVISPWARRGYVSHVNANFMSVFATITRILGVPPMGRPDAAASPMWDMFTGTPDYTPFDALPRRVPEEKILDLNTPGARESLQMDFRGPDRNTELGVVLDAYRLWRMGRIDADEAQRRIDGGVRSMPAAGPFPERVLRQIREELEEEAEEEIYAYDLAFLQYEQWLGERGLAMPAITGGPLDSETIDALFEGRIPVHELRRFER